MAATSAAAALLEREASHNRARKLQNNTKQFQEDINTRMMLCLCPFITLCDTSYYAIIVTRSNISLVFQKYYFNSQTDDK